MSISQKPDVLGQLKVQIQNQCNQFSLLQYHLSVGSKHKYVYCPFVQLLQEENLGFNY